MPGRQPSARPSSVERLAAASIAESSAARTPWFSSSRIAAIVVPPGEVTASRSVTGCSPESRNIVAEPTADWMISCADTLRGSPSRMPASIIASTRKKKYAGPEPDSAVTASCCDSGTRTTLPTEDSRSCTICRCAAVACVPGEIALIASRTTIGVFGITRTTGIPSGKRLSYSEVGRPAATDTTRVPGVIVTRIWSMSGPMSCGLTATMTTSASAAASAGVTARTPYRALTSAARSSDRSENISVSAERPAESSPDSSASPILPAPRIAITFIGDVITVKPASTRASATRRAHGRPAAARQANRQANRPGSRPYSSSVMIEQPAPQATGMITRLAASARRARRTGGLVMITAVVLLALNLRPAVNALGVVIPQLQESTGLGGTVAGVLLALPTLCFAVVGFAASGLAQRLGSHRAVLLALVLLTGGQVLRAVVDGIWALFAGSILALGGIAIGNVLLPGLIRRHFPSAIGPMTAVYTTSLMIGQTLGAGVTLPIENGLGGTWRLGIGMWAVTAATALVPWIAAAMRTPDRAAAPAASAAAEATARAAAQAGRRVTVLSLVRSRHAWAMAVFFGMQSLQAYVVFGWMPTVLADAGMSEGAASGIMAIITAMGIPVSAVVPALLGAIRRQGALVIAFISASVLGYVGLIIMPTTLTWVLGALIGFGLGAFPMALTLMALRARTHEGTTALSAFGQSVGYLLASIGPVGFGFLHDVSGGSTVPLIAMIGTLVPMLLGGLVVVRDWKIEDGAR